MSQTTKTSGSGTQGDGGGVGEEGEDQEDSSSSSSKPIQSLNPELESFRAKWRKELQSCSASQHHDASKDEDDPEETDEDMARKLFLVGVENEQQGKLYEAVQFYRRAVQLVPDIELRLYESSNPRAAVEPSEREQDEVVEDNFESGDEDEMEEFDPTQSDLMSHLKKVLAKSSPVCQEKTPQKSTHISALPVEIILYILRWVVSSDLDTRSLDMCSAVSRGFYVCSRDPGIWRLACTRVWGVRCGSLSEKQSWRDMFNTRPRIHFHGCYISMTTYVRSGEKSYQDQFYRPWHIVKYYRYLRFFPDGLVLMLTTPEEPLSCLGLLKARTSRHPGVMVGNYRMFDEILTLRVAKPEIKYRSLKNSNVQEQFFNLEFEMMPQRGKKPGRLRWILYSVYTSTRNNCDTATAFDVGGSRFPPLSFSRVKSYTAESDYPLM